MINLFADKNDNKRINLNKALEKTFFLLFFGAHVFLLNSCSNGSQIVTEEKKQTMVSVVNWNVQTFFDCETEGIEYSDFIKNQKWTKESYSQRLERLCSAMIKLNGDIYIFEEIENENVIRDISNYFAEKSWNNKKNWKYTCFAKEENSAIGIGIFSRFPLDDFKTHRLDIRTQKVAQPSSRLLLQAGVCIDNKNLIIIANHWKSKSGGEYTSEIWRDWQENQLCNKLLSIDENTPVLICGDFNRSAEDFICKFNSLNRNKNIILRGTENNSMVYSPWFSDTGDFISDTGSYYYEKKWERIDNFFGYGNIKISGFNPKADSPWANASNGVPERFVIYTGKGYSDHLPIMCTVMF